MAANTVFTLLNKNGLLIETTATAASDVTTPTYLPFYGHAYRTQVTPSAANAGATVVLEGNLTVGTSLTGGEGGVWNSIHSITVTTGATGFGAATISQPFNYIRHNVSAFVSSGAAHLTIRTLVVPIPSA